MGDLTTSKKLLWVFVIFYLCLFSILVFLDVKYKINVKYYLEYIQPIICTIIVSYFGKAGVENYNKIKLYFQEDNQNQQIVLPPINQLSSMDNNSANPYKLK